MIYAKTVKYIGLPWSLAVLFAGLRLIPGMIPYQVKDK